MNLRFESPFGGQQTDVSAQEVSAHDPINDNWVVRKGGGGDVLFVDSVTIPKEVASDGVVDVTIEVVNAALFISPTDADHCSQGGNAGYEYEVRVTPDWTNGSQRVNCLDLAEDRAIHEFSFNAPESAGTYTVDVVVEGVGSGFSGSGSFEVVVPDEGGPTRPDPDPVDGGDGGGSPIPGIGGGSGFTLGLASGLGLLLILLVLLIVVGR